MDIFFVVHYVLPRIRAYLIDYIRMICHLSMQAFFIDNLLAFQYFRSEPVGSTGDLSHTHSQSHSLSLSSADRLTDRLTDVGLTDNNRITESRLLSLI